MEKEMKRAESIQKLENELKKLQDKTFTIYFYVMDTKGTPSGYLSYIYDTALTLQNKGYKIAILHQSEEFVGVGEWLGETYVKFPHFNVTKDEVAVSSSDIIMIPEIFTNVMKEIANLPCKKVVLVQNLNYITEFIPIGETWASYGIREFVTTSKEKLAYINDLFPNMKGMLVRPQINEKFTVSKKPSKLVINIIAREQSDVNRIIKPFQWKYPSYNWLSFRELRGLSKDDFIIALQEGAITIWVDDYAPFGYSGLEAIKCGSYVIGKVPDEIPEWMGSEDGLLDNGIWFSDIKEVPQMLLSVVNGWINNKIPNEIDMAIQESQTYFTPEIQEIDIENVYVNEIIESRRKELMIMLNYLKTNE